MSHPVPEAPFTARGRGLLLAAAVTPTLITLVVGLTHPMSLNASSAEWWRNLHIVLLPIFPLIGAAPWLVSRRSSALWRRLAGVGGFVFAVYYSALDVLAGIGAGAEQLAGHPEAKHQLYSLADIFGPIGVAGFVIAWIAATIGVMRSTGSWAAFGFLGAIGAVLVQKSHVVFPLGTLGLALIIVAAAALVLAPRAVRRNTAV